MFKVGDIVICIDTKSYVGLTLYREYKVIGSCSDYVCIRTDYHYERLFFNSLFKKKTQKYSSCKSMEVDSINEEYGPCKKAQIQYHLDKLKELTQ